MPEARMLSIHNDGSAEWEFTREFIAPHDLTGRASYQRPLRVLTVSRLANGWRPELCMPLTVNRRPSGQLVVIDGQHRMAAAIEADIAALECRVFRLSSVSQEAALFRDLNTASARVTPGEVLRANREGGDPEAIAVIDLCERFGFHLDYFMLPGPDVFRCVATVLQVYRDRHIRTRDVSKPNPQRLERCLRVLKRVWKDETKRTDGDILSGMAHFLSLYPEADDDVLVRQLDEMTPGQVLGRSRVGGGSGSGTRRMLISSVMWKQYNAGAPAKEKLPGRYSPSIRVE